MFRRAPVCDSRAKRVYLQRGERKRCAADKGPPKLGGRPSTYNLQESAHEQGIERVGTALENDVQQGYYQHDRASHPKRNREEFCELHGLGFCDEVVK